MRGFAFVLLLAFCYVQCKKTYAPIDKNANLAFINMETGGYGAGAKKIQPAPVLTPTKAPVAPAPAPQPTPTKAPVAPAPAPQPITPKPALPTQKPHVQPVSAPTSPSQIKPKPVNPIPVANPITTPGPGSVKQLVNFYDSQGKASPIRPYSYSQAVKQG